MGEAGKNLYAGVVVEAPLTKVFHYRVPERLAEAILPGDRAEIPFARRRTRGVVVSLTTVPPIDPKLIKDLLGLSPPEERIPGDILELSKWVSSYYRSGWGTVLAAAVPAGVKQGRRERTRLRVDISLPPAVVGERADALAKRAPRQAECLRTLAKWFAGNPGGTLMADDPVIGDSATRTVLRQLEARGLIALGSPEPGAATAFPEKTREIVMSPEQEAALAGMARHVGTGEFKSFLLHGVTGSGKTEVYIRLIEKCLAAGKGVLVLVPEISLTPQTVSRFSSRFGEIAVLHSNLGDGERARHWRRLCSGEVGLAVGARSAVFAPVRDIGLIVVDEEHEGSYKQDNDPRYHARDVALVRGAKAGALVVLGSATPSLESWVNAGAGKHGLVSMPTRPGGAKPPRVEMVDLRREWADVKRPVLFSRRLELALEECLKRREQAIVFLNRRGFHTSVRCGACGDSVECENCDVAMTHFRGERLLRCGACGHETGVPDACPTCGGKALRFVGAGTERAEGMLRELFPKARLVRMDRDSMTARDAHRETLAAFARGEYDILLGTQMVAKGLDFPNVTLVGVLMADAALGMSDFRAAERTFQLVTQVIGRAGRADKEGLAIVQAFQPEHRAVECAVGQDYLSFVENEAPDRKKHGYPPYGRMARIVVAGENDDAVRRAADAAGGALSAAMPAGCRLLGPTACEIEKMQKMHRRHLMLFGSSHIVLSEWLAAWGKGSGTEKGVRFILDMDPVSML